MEFEQFAVVFYMFSVGLPDRYQRAGRDGRSVLCGPPEAEEVDRVSQSPTWVGFGQRRDNHPSKNREVCFNTNHISSEELLLINKKQLIFKDIYCIVIDFFSY